MLSTKTKEVNVSIAEKFITGFQAVDATSAKAQQRCIENVNARKAATTLIDELAVELLQGTKEPIHQQRFWELVVEMAQSRIGKPSKDKLPMDDLEARKFEERKVPSTHALQKGKEVREVDPDYWLVVQESNFSRQLRRYLRSRRFRANQALQD